MSTRKFPLFLAVALAVLGCGSDSGSRSNESRSTAGSAAGGSSAERDASTPDASTSASERCDPGCESPARCEEDDGKWRCTCPSGYDDKNGDGTRCEDKDECADETSPCDRNAECKNEPGSFSCTCRAPAYQGDGKTCDCADGFEKSGRFCLAPDGDKCEDNLDCANEHCVSGICCAQACSSPDGECRNADAATCSDGKTCEYPVADDGAACDSGDACTSAGSCKEGKCTPGTEPKSCDDDNPCTDDSCDAVLGCKNVNNTAECDDKSACTDGDRCSAGRCGGSARDCSAAAGNDICSVGVCDAASGECKKQAVEGKACNDGNSCTSEDKCVAGACVGGSACGADATACVAGEVVAGSVACSCTDKAGAAVTCSAPADPCMGNPCGEGRGTCSPMSGMTETYSCTCNAGLIPVGGTCGCNLDGTFAVRTQIALSWEAMDPIEAGSGQTSTWRIERHTTQLDGSLRVSLTECGETNLDLCGEGLALARIPAEAYAQYVPIDVWKADGPATVINTSVATPWPTGKFTLPEYAALKGISLTDPMGEWPASHHDVQGLDGFDGTATNGAQWLNSDNDEILGLTTYTVGPTGVAADGSALAPIEGYTGTSSVCPRSKPDAPRLAYNYPPTAEGVTLAIRRVKRFSSANRIISAADGIINACDSTGNATDISGEVTGMRFDTRIGACTRAGDNGAADAPCSQSVVNFVDSTSAPNKVTASSFVMKRVADSVSCEEVRALLPHK